MKKIKSGSKYFNRFLEEVSRLSPHIKLRRIKFGFYRIYYKGFYIGECYKEMPYKGYDILQEDPGFLNQSYYEEYEDSAKLTRHIKNFVEGYWDSIKTLRKRLYLLKHDNEFYQNSKKAYQQFIVK